MPRIPYRKSHPTRVRGLKQSRRSGAGIFGPSHPTRVRGLKPICPKGDESE